jgi:hypothetical protein
LRREASQLKRRAGTKVEMLRRENGAAPQHDNARALAACLNIKAQREITVSGVV